MVDTLTSPFPTISKGGLARIGCMENPCTASSICCSSIHEVLYCMSLPYNIFSRLPCSLVTPHTPCFACVYKLGYCGGVVGLRGLATGEYLSLFANPVSRFRMSTGCCSLGLCFMVWVFIRFVLLYGLIRLASHSAPGYTTANKHGYQSILESH
jgi:hypothetical protein